MNDSTINIPLPTSEFLTLVDFLKEEGSNRDPIDVIRGAIEYWIDNASWKKEDLMPETLNYEGYQWKQLHLPHATLIRMKYKDKFYHAEVCDGGIIYENETVLSPSNFVAKVTETSRNAWRDLEIKRPFDSEWHSASSLRDSL